MHERIKQILDASGVRYSLRLHADFGAISSSGEFAAAIGYAASRISKTLLLRSRSGFIIWVAPGNRRVDLKLLARAISAPRLQMASARELQELLGYPSAGVSPIGSMGIPVYLDSALMPHETILLGAGVLAEEIEMEPSVLTKLISACLIELPLL